MTIQFDAYPEDMIDAEFDYMKNQIQVCTDLKTLENLEDDAKVLGFTQLIPMIAAKFKDLRHMWENKAKTNANTVTRRERREMIKKYYDLTKAINTGIKNLGDAYFQMWNKRETLKFIIDTAIVINDNDNGNDDQTILMFLMERRYDLTNRMNDLDYCSKLYHDTSICRDQVIEMLKEIDC
jgi:hypothetical protein